MSEEIEYKEVLIIEDESDVRFLLVNLLKKNGYQAHSCATLECGRNELNGREYDVIILDINLKDGNGLSLLESQVIPEHTRVIVMSALNDMKIRAIELGAFRFLSKPFSNMNLLDAIEGQSAS